MLFLYLQFTFLHYNERLVNSFKHNHKQTKQEFIVESEIHNVIIFLFQLNHRYYNYDLFLKDIFKQRWQKELGRQNPMADSTFLELPVRDRVELLHALCDFRLDADDISEMLKVW